jgi:hypothetical protein
VIRIFTPPSGSRRTLKRSPVVVIGVSRHQAGTDNAATLRNPRVNHSPPKHVSENGHLAYVLFAPGLVRSFTSAGAPALRKRQTRREAGAQSLRASLGEAAGLPNGGGVITGSGQPHP